MKKRVHLIRHGQSLFNAAFAQSRVDPMIFDAPLSPLGREQVATMRATGSALDVEVIVTSPLTRAIETTLGVFADHGAAMVVEALHRERVEHSCDVGRSPAALAEAFPQLAFHHLDDPPEGGRDERPGREARKTSPLRHVRLRHREPLHGSRDARDLRDGVLR